MEVFSPRASKGNNDLNLYSKTNSDLVICSVSEEFSNSVLWFYENEEFKDKALGLANIHLVNFNPSNKEQRTVASLSFLYGKHTVGDNLKQG